MRGISTGIPGGWGSQRDRIFRCVPGRKGERKWREKIRERDPSSVIKREKLHIPFDREENVESTDVPSKKKKRKKKEEEKRESETVKKKKKMKFSYEKMMESRKDQRKKKRRGC